MPLTATVASGATPLLADTVNANGPAVVGVPIKMPGVEIDGDEPSLSPAGRVPDDTKKTVGNGLPVASKKYSISTPTYRFSGVGCRW